MLQIAFVKTCQGRLGLIVCPINFTLSIFHIPTVVLFEAKLFLLFKSQLSASILHLISQWKVPSY